LPERADLLAECVASVGAQSVAPLEHLVEVDHERTGEPATMNRLLAKCKGDFWVWLNDDDLLDPSFLEELLPFTAEADVVYSHCRLGELDWGFHMGDVFDADRLRQANYIPCTALISTKLTREVGGINDLEHCEDWDLWLRLLDADARFHCVPRPLWQYRFQAVAGHVNKSVWV
jgi:hypothetical protein